MSYSGNSVCPKFISNQGIQEVFHVYLNKSENVVTHLFLVIFGNN